MNHTMDRIFEVSSKVERGVFLRGDNNGCSVSQLGNALEFLNVNSWKQLTLSKHLFEYL